MIRFTLRQLAATTILAAAASLAPTLAQEAPAGGAAPPYQSKPYTIPSKGISKVIREAVESPDRPPYMVQRDGWRRPAEILALSQVKAGSRVVQLMPYPMYYAPLLSKVVGAKGEVHMYDQPVFGEQYGEDMRKFAEAHPNTKYQVVDFNKIEFPRNVDLVFSVHAYHLMLLTGVDFDAFHSKLFKAMKPGAIYLVIDHAATHGTETNDTARLQRVDPGIIRAGVQSGGFQLIEDSRLLENTQDDHKWPSFQQDKLDQTDQVVYKFRKPVVY